MLEPTGLEKENFGFWGRWSLQFYVVSQSHLQAVARKVVAEVARVAAKMGKVRTLPNFGSPTISL